MSGGVAEEGWNKNKLKQRFGETDYIYIFIPSLKVSKKFHFFKSHIVVVTFPPPVSKHAFYRDV